MRDIGEREGWAKLRAGGLSIAKSSLRAILADHLQRSGNREMGYRQRDRMAMRCIHHA
jgi:putative DNA primase/helicase